MSGDRVLAARATPLYRDSGGAQPVSGEGP